MARCNCASPTSCGCALASGNTVSIANSGTPADPWVPEVILATTNPGLQVITGAGAGLEAFVNTAGGLVKDTNGIAVDPLQFVPRGTMAYSQITANTSAVSATTDSGLSVTWTAVAGRRYKITAQADWFGSVGTDLLEAFITDGSNVQKQRQVWTVPGISAASGYGHVGFSFLEVPGAGSITRKLRHGRNSGTGTSLLIAGATQPAFLVVEDVGT